MGVSKRGRDVFFCWGAEPWEISLQGFYGYIMITDFLVTKVGFDAVGSSIEELDFNKPHLGIRVIYYSKS